MTRKSETGRTTARRHRHGDWGMRHDRTDGRAVACGNTLFRNARVRRIVVGHCVSYRIVSHRIASHRAWASLEDGNNNIVVIHVSLSYSVRNCDGPSREYPSCHRTPRLGTAAVARELSFCFVFMFTTFSSSSSSFCSCSSSSSSSSSSAGAHPSRPAN